MNWFDKNILHQTRMNITPDLSNFENACIAAGSPHRRLNNIIHVAGTNGKGSTIAFLSSILKHAGYKVNTATSPHLIRFNERINLEGRDISNLDLKRIYNEYSGIMEKYNLSYFERSILVTFVAFAETNADFNIIEVGIGGTLDATNIIKNPLFCIITSISIDHCNILGNNIRDISKNKAGIIKPNAKVVVGYNSPEVIQEITSNKNNTFFIGGKDWFIDKNWNLGLKGNHQLFNAGNAVAVAKELNISETNILEGINKAKWPGRMHYISKNIILDGAHNEDGVLSLVTYLQTIDKPKIGVMAVVKDKNITGTAEHLKDVFDHIYCIEIDSAPDRMLSMSSLLDHLSDQNIKASRGGHIKNFNTNQFEDMLVVIFGSLFLVGEYLSLDNKEV